MNRGAVISASYALAGLGLIIGIAGWVKTGAGILALGAGGISLTRQSSGKIERFLPIALAVALLILAIALPVKR